MQYTIGCARITLVEQGRVSILVLELNHLGGNMIERGVPGDAFEFTFATLPDAHHGIQQALCRVDALAV